MQIQVNDFSMEYQDQGRGIPLVLIHGYPLTADLWEPQIQSLAPVARVIAPSLRGHGASDPVRGPYNMDMLADDVKTLLDHLGLRQRIFVGGLSMGGYVAFAFYRKFPEHVAGLLLAATRSGQDSPEGKANRENAIHLALGQGAAAIASGMLAKMFSPKTYQTNPDLVDRARTIMENVSVEGIVGDQQAMLDRPDSTPTLAQITVPTLILHGADDQIIPVREAEAMQRGIPEAYLQVLPEAGHLLNLEQPGLFNRAVHDFIREHYSITTEV